MSRAWKNVKPALSAEVLDILENEFKFHKMTPVQAVTLPLFLQHKDVCVQAQTGSGKTLAFIVPIVEILLRRTTPLNPHQVGAIVMSPTRELATQIATVARRFVNLIPTLSLLSLIGGTGTQQDEDQFTNVGGNIVIATPGRLKHTFATLQTFNCSQLEVLVLDEADRLLDLGFELTITNILRRLPKQRRTGLFSATQTQEVKQLAKAGLRNPVNVKVDVKKKSNPSASNSSSSSSSSSELSSSVPETLSNHYQIVRPERKLDHFVSYLLKHAATEKVITFFLTGAFVDYMATLLPQISALKHIKFFALHGKMQAKKRVRTYEAFVKEPVGVLLCTDLAARGLDVPDVTTILQYDAPQVYINLI